MLARLFARPLLLVPGLVVLLVVGSFAYSRVGSGFLPRMDEGGFVLDYYTAPGTSLAETNRELSRSRPSSSQDPNVYTYSRRTGAGLGGDLNEAYQGDFFVRLIDPGKRATDLERHGRAQRKDHRAGAGHQCGSPISS